ncbi:bifunctional lytic transglycosylase/C40 family peptidase [Paenibacillus periandrae]|uniref:bifunctional lytic transglycosylase/C40 family peptidase n=1 Tax=Paenibacillus periandrae TaxID=1761741 RepID=UPI001F088E82|nr:bifunctional lytic transglycosylase/C40 family peptidase [Paenibacillus periandrae]
MWSEWTVSNRVNAQDLTNDAAGQAGGAGKKVAGKAARKAAGKAVKILKKLAMDFLKKLLLAAGKSLIAIVGPVGLLVIVAIILVVIILSAIPYSDWFLDGNSRSESQKKADIEYEQKFKTVAEKTVVEVNGIEASESWKSSLKNIIKPSWGIPAALVRYQIIVNNKKVELSDYDPNILINAFKPKYSYTKIRDDVERTKSVTYCSWSDSEGNSYHTGPDTMINTNPRSAHDVLSRVTFDYGDMEIKPLKKYYPGGTLELTDQWNYKGTSTNVHCTTDTYTQYDHTTVDDRFVPNLNIDGTKFQNILVSQGINKTDMKLVYEFIRVADSNWNPFLYGANNDSTGSMYAGQAKVSEAVSRYEPLVRKYAIINNIEDQVNLILAMIQQESGGGLLDVMQSSESAGLPPNTLTDPEISIMYGVKHFASVFRSAGGDVNLTLQSYNFGGGFIPYANERGGYSKENVVAFSQMMAAKNGWSRYGDVDYVDHVMRYYTNWSSLKVSSDGQIFDVQAVLDFMSKYMGIPYVWGGRKPEQGGFDCSGLIEYTFNQFGINLNGNAETQYNKTAAVTEAQALPGDLVFWSTYKKEPSHVGMYLGNNKFINSNDSGLVISPMDGYWSKGFLGYRRIVK